MVCQNCGTQLPDGTPACPTCGAQLMAQQPYMDPNQALFNQAPVATPVKKNNTGMIIGIVAAIVAVIAIVIVAIKLIGGGSSEYDGTYKFTKGYAMGIEVTVEQMEAASGTSYDMTLTVKGNKCTMEAEAMGVEKAVCKITFDGNDVTLVDGNDEFTGTYDPEEKSISINEPSTGTILVFELVD